MTNPDNSNTEKATWSPPPQQQQPAPVDLESGAAEGGGGVANILQRGKREDLLKKGWLASRGFGFVFSLLAFLVMVTNKHGGGRNFDNYEEYKYVLGIAILSTLYTGLQVFRQYKELSTGRPVFSWEHLPMADFFCDQIMAYLLISAASSAVPLTNNMREGGDNIFTDASASAISMQFLAFFSMALSALFSGWKLTKQSYI